MGKGHQNTIKGLCVHAHVNVSEIYNPEIRIQEQKKSCIVDNQPEKVGLHIPTLEKNTV